MSPDTCPNCGAEVPRGAKACPECGSDEKTGWSGEARYSELDLPEENFDYKDFVEREFGKRPVVPRGMHWFWWLVAVLVLGAVFWLWLK
jgi:hypothetical protein